MKKLIALSIAVLPFTSMAGEMALDLQFDEDGKATPVSTYSHDWNENFYSQVKYRSLSITEADTSIDSTKSATTLNEQFVQLNLIGYKQTMGNAFMSVGGGLELIRIVNNEFAFGKHIGETFVITNDVEITSTRAMLNAELGYSADKFSIKGGINVKPAGNLSVKQDTKVEYESDFTGGGDNSHSTDLAYSVSLDGLLLTGLGFDIGFGVEHSLLPLKYDLDIVSDNTLTAFETVSFAQDETTTRYSIRFILGKETDMGRPMVGMTSETLSVKSDEGTSDNTVNYLVLGFDRRF